MRRVSVWGIAGLLASCVACGSVMVDVPRAPLVGGTGVTTSSPTPRTTVPPPPQPQLPRGGTTVFPRYRVVSYYGTAGTSALGVLGSAPPEQIVPRLEKAAAAFATPDRIIQPAMELIVTVADSRPGPDGNYSHPIDPAIVRRYLAVARAHRQLLVLDVQPGHSTFLPEVQRWEELLVEPDVGLALDPEWRMPDGNAPGQVIGHVDAPEVNAVTSWLAELTRAHNLPQKLFVLHMFTDSMVTNLGAVAGHPELAMVQHLDGFGGRADKLAKYQGLQRPAQFHLGFKLFYTEDVDLLSPREVLTLKPPPEYLSYQ